MSEKIKIRFRPKNKSDATVMECKEGVMTVYIKPDEKGFLGVDKSTLKRLNYYLTLLGEDLLIG